MFQLVLQVLEDLDVFDIADIDNAVTALDKEVSPPTLHLICYYEIERRTVVLVKLLMEL